MLKKTLSAILCVCISLCVFAPAALAADPNFDLTIGLRKYSANTGAVAASGFAQITSSTYVNGEEHTKEGTSNYIFSLPQGASVTLTTSLIDRYAPFYEFDAWVDANSVILSEEATYTFTMGAASCAVFALYTEKVDRHVITMLSSDGGSISISDPMGLFIDGGSTQVSVLDGSSPVLKFKAADDNHYVSSVSVNGTVITSWVYMFKTVFSRLFSGDFAGVAKAIAVYNDVTNKYVGTMTLENVTSDQTIEVEFSDSKIEKAPSFDWIWYGIRLIIGLFD